jgi:hypothetical protein
MRRSLRDPPNETPVRPANLKIGKRTAPQRARGCAALANSCEPLLAPDYGLPRLRREQLRARVCLTKPLPTRAHVRRRSLSSLG